jgi:putative transposase
MPRRARVAPGGWIFHVTNRANAREKLFESETDYREFAGLLARCAKIDHMRILAWCLMPNHWHFLLWPREDGDLYRFIHRLSIRHTQHWHIRNGTIGRGHLYQARFKSFAVQDDRHLLTVCRYIERNPVRAKLSEAATNWRWSSARDHVRGNHNGDRPELERLPVDVPEDWGRWLRDPEDTKDLERMRSHLATDVPFGDEAWATLAGQTLGVPSRPRGRGRPRKEPDAPPRQLSLDSL